MPNYCFSIALEQIMGGLWFPHIVLKMLSLVSVVYFAACFDEEC